jgi:hypothetical protein
MNNEAYRILDCKEIITKDHYYRRNNNKFVLLPSDDPYIGEKADRGLIFEKISLEDFRILKDDEIVNEEHFQVLRDSFGYLRMFRCYLFSSCGKKSIDVRKDFSHIFEYNLYAKKTQFNFETLNILKDIEL